jgi:hypothetical protein
MLLLACLLGSCTNDAAATGAPEPPRVVVRALLDPHVARAVYDIRIYTQDPNNPSQYLLTLSVDDVESNGPEGSLVFATPCVSAPDPGRPGKVEMTMVAYDASGAPLGPPQTQVQLFLCLGKSENFSGDNFVSPFVFTIVAPLDRGFADITVQIRDLRIVFKVDISELLTVRTSTGALGTAKTAVTALAAARLGSGAALPILYLLGDLVTPVQCLACGPGGQAGPLDRRVFFGVEDASLGSEQTRFLNSAWQMPQGSPFTTDGDFHLEAFGLVFPAAPAQDFVVGGTYVAYSVDSLYQSGIYADQKSAEVRFGVVTGRVSEPPATEHVFLVQNVPVLVGTGAPPMTTAGFELVVRRSAIANTQINVPVRRRYYVRDSSGARLPVVGVSAMPIAGTSLRFLVFLAAANDPQRTILGAVRCEVSSTAESCETVAEGEVLMRPVTAQLLAGET